MIKMGIRVLYRTRFLDQLSNLELYQESPSIKQLLWFNQRCVRSRG